MNELKRIKAEISKIENSFNATGSFSGWFSQVESGAQRNLGTFVVSCWKIGIFYMKTALDQLNQRPQTSKGISNRSDFGHNP